MILPPWPSNHPIQPHKTWGVRDASKFEDFYECNRLDFYRHILGWQADAPNNDLWFGASVHQAMEHLMLNGYAPERVLEAYHEKFLPHYRTKFPAETDELFCPKDAEGALHLITNYTGHYEHDFDEFEVVYTEISGTVPISQEPYRILHFRMDTIIRLLESGMYASLEHKTKKGDFNWADLWAADFDLKIQPGAYTHVLYCLYSMDQVRGVKINGLGIKHLKTKGYVTDYKRVPIWRAPHHMATWLWQINDHYTRWEYELERLSMCTEDDFVMQAFPMNPGRCTKYFRLCSFHTFCTSWPNPLQHCHAPPMGFKEEFWDPRELDARHIMNLEGKKEEDS